MLNRFYTRAISLASPLLVLGFFSLLLCPTAGNAFERRILLEDFTSTTCGPCEDFAPTLVDILEEAGDAVVPIAIHVNWPPPGNDPWWGDNADDNRARVDYYSVNGVPTIYVDGTFAGRQGYIPSRADVQNLIDDHIGGETPINLELSAFFPDYGELIARVSVTSDENLSNLTLFIALQEKYYHFHAPNGLTEHYDAMVMMLPDGDGTSFNIEANQTKDFELRREMIADYWHDIELDNLRLVAWVQDRQKNVLQASNFDMSPTSPVITMENWQMDDAVNGDGDGRPEAGETADLTLTVKAVGNYLDAESVNISLSVDDEAIEVLNGQYEHGALDAGDELDNHLSPLQFRVPEGFEVHPVTFTVTITAQPGDYVADFPITFMVGWPPFLVVDATGFERAGEYVFGPFGLDNLPYADQLNTMQDALTTDLASNYDAILWHTFNAQDAIITEWDQTVLTDYLDNGGMLILSGSYIATELDGTDLMENYLGVSAGASGNRYNFVKGMAGDPHFADANVFLGAREAVDWPQRTTILNPGPGASEVLRYELNGNDVGAAGVRNETDTYRTLFLSFPIECIGGFNSSDTLETFLGYVNAWVQSGLAVPPGDEPVATEFTLEPAYPNPFNGQTVVPFSLIRDGVVNLTLFDLVGRKIADVASSRMTAGRHQVTLNAGDLRMPNGIYTLQLLTSEGMRSQKLLYLR